MEARLFVEEMEKRCIKLLEKTRLSRLRENRGFSQADLSKASGVGLKSIQMYEQRLNDIDKAQAHTVYKLARAIGCNVEDLLEQPTVIGRDVL
jgi:transcriptional regulator with XRE-family HTH domain